MRHLCVGWGIEQCVSQGEGWGAGVGWITSMATLLRTVDEALSPKNAQYTSTLLIASSPSPPPQPPSFVQFTLCTAGAEGIRISNFREERSLKYKAGIWLLTQISCLLVV